MQFQLTHLLRGATYASVHGVIFSINFNSRTSCEVRLGRVQRYVKHLAFQLTHLLRGATDTKCKKLPCQTYFNSRTSCEVRHSFNDVFGGVMDFNSRTSCEVRRSRNVSRPFGVTFQLTHLLRGATWVAINPILQFISTHAPLARCDESELFRLFQLRPFQLTHLLRGATFTETMHDTAVRISTHAPLARCDERYKKEEANGQNFNSRTSCEVRPAGLSV